MNVVFHCSKRDLDPRLEDGEPGVDKLLRKLVG